MELIDSELNNKKCKLLVAKTDKTLIRIADDLDMGDKVVFAIDENGNCPDDNIDNYKEIDAEDSILAQDK